LILTFHHGWGFDHTLWDRLVPLLPDHHCHADDRGYFGPSRMAPAGTIAVTHSFGTLRVLADPPPGLAAIVAINGFDCFAARPGFPGIPPRVLARMQARFAQEPAAVLADFRARCGADAAPPIADRAALAADLAALAGKDARQPLGIPLLSLQAQDDPLLPPEMRGAVFASTPAADRFTAPFGGHLLPLTDPARCAAAIRAMAERLG